MSRHGVDLEWEHFKVIHSSLVPHSDYSCVSQANARRGSIIAMQQCAGRLTYYVQHTPSESQSKFRELHPLLRHHLRTATAPS